MATLITSRPGVGLKGSAATVGMMEGAFFVGRTELLSWVNGILQTSLSKVEQCASGAIYCQILDSCHPGTVSMKKVNWMAKSDHEFVPNYKVLQAAFDKNSIQRHVAVDQLIRAKYQDNLEFLQFMKCYWEHEGSRDYDPLPAREGKQLPPWVRSASDVAAPRPVSEKENVKPRAAPPAPPAVAASKPAAAEKRPSSATAAEKRPSSGSGRTATAAVAAATRVVAASAARPSSRSVAVPPSPTAAADVASLQKKVAAQSEEIDDMKHVMEGIEHERDYYFRKLREVEIMCSTLQSQLEGGNAPADVTPLKVVTEVQSILYAENEEEATGSPKQPASVAETPPPSV